jgi:hypothetical protein
MKGLFVFAIDPRRSRRAEMERAPATLAMVLMEVMQLVWTNGCLPPPDLFLEYTNEV